MNNWVARMWGISLTKELLASQILSYWSQTAVLPN